MTPLFDYQVSGAFWLANTSRAILADDMGLGKTAQAVTAAELVNSPRVLVICPAIARAGWSRAWLQFGERDTLLRRVRIVSFDGAWSQREALRRWQPHTVIVDEAHYLKEGRTRRARTVLGENSDGKGGLIDGAANVWLLTGTPAPNNASELWPLLRACDVWRGSFAAFRKEFCETTDNSYGVKITGNRNADGMRAMLARVMLRRLKSEVLTDLPPITVGDVTLDGSDIDKHEPVMARLRQLEPELHAALDKALAEKEFKLREVPALATIRRLIGLAKVRSTLEMVRAELDAQPKQKIVLFAIHREVIAHLVEGLANYGARPLVGGMTDKSRSQTIDEFQALPDRRVIVAQTVAAGTAITLTASNSVVIVEPSWVPSDNAQAIMRVHRIGQTQRTLARFVSLADSVDTRLNDALRSKIAMISEIISTGPVAYAPAA